MLFGAGLILMPQPARAGFADTYLRRNLWLLLFGVVHGYFIWEGDILYPYALCGFLMFPFRKLSPKARILAGVLVISVMTPKSWLQAFDLEYKKKDSALAEAAKARGQKLTEEQEGAISTWKEKLKELKPPEDEVDKQIQNYRGT